MLCKWLLTRCRCPFSSGGGIGRRNVGFSIMQYAFSEKTRMDSHAHIHANAQTYMHACERPGAHAHTYMANPTPRKTASCQRSIKSSKNDHLSFGPMHFHAFVKSNQLGPLWRFQSVSPLFSYLLCSLSLSLSLSLSAL